jgi:hypothetical protein
MPISASQQQQRLEQSGGSKRLIYNNVCKHNALLMISGGEGEIRTPETLTRPPVFETTGIYVTTCYILRFQIVGNIVGKCIQHIGKLST